MSTTTGSMGSTGSLASSTDPGDRSAAEIEREVEATRAGLTDTLDQLREKASPSQVFEQAVDWARSSGGSEMLRNLGTQVRENPLPLLLIGAGIGWMMLSGGRGADAHAPAARPLALPPPSGMGGGSSRVRAYPTASTADHAGGPAMAMGGSTGGGMTGAARSVGDSISGAAQGVAESVSGAAERVADAASSAWRGVAGSASSAGEGMGGAASSAARQVAETGQALRGHAEQGLGWIMREQPLVLGAIGVALGAAVGALLPGTETEDRLMGEARDSLAEQAGAVAQEGYARLKDTAGEHLDRARGAVGEAADRQGLSNAGEALGGAARELGNVVREAARDLAGEAKSALGAADEGRAPAGSGQPRHEGGGPGRGGAAI